MTMRTVRLVVRKLSVIAVVLALYQIHALLFFLDLLRRAVCFYVVFFHLIHALLGFP